MSSIFQRVQRARPKIKLYFCRDLSGKSFVAQALNLVPIFAMVSCTQGSGSFNLGNKKDGPVTKENSPNTPPKSPQEPPSIDNPAPVSPPKPDPTETPGEAYLPLSWEKVRAEGKSWSQFLHESIRLNFHNMLEEVQDMETFCPRYKSLTETEKINAFGMLIAGVVKYESSYNPLRRYRESTMGKDPITGEQVVSEGLLQLSYQDIRGWPACQFDWKHDKILDPTDPHRTILDPYRNLDCGLRILASQIRRRGHILLEKNVYWATLKINGKYEKIQPIIKIVKTLKFCL